MGPVTGLRVGLTAPARHRRPAWVPQRIATAVVMLFGGLREGLFCLGLPVPPGNGTLSRDHGELMVLGFLGTLIALERAGGARRNLGVSGAGRRRRRRARDRRRSARGSRPGAHRRGGLALVAIFAAVHRIQPSLHNVVLAAAALCRVVSDGLWIAGWDIAKFVPWLVGFLVLTIAGERLELSRMTGTSRRERMLFAAAGLFAAGLFAAGLLTSPESRPVSGDAR